MNIFGNIVNRDSYFRKLSMATLQVAAAVISIPTPVDQSQHFSILFIGNSYTSYNDLPDMVAKVAASDKKNPRMISVKSVTHFGYRLDQTCDTGEVQELLATNRFNI